jgi:hypothetical protein
MSEKQIETFIDLEIELMAAQLRNRRETQDIFDEASSWSSRNSFGTTSEDHPLSLPTWNP